MLTRPPSRRSGATTVETAVVMSVFLLVLFGVFEYCRFLLALHAATNACRDAARYAVVNTTKPADFDTTAYRDAAGRVYPSVAQYCRERMAGVDRMIASAAPTTYYTPDGAEAGTAGCRIEVFPCDPAKLTAAAPAAAPKPGAAGWNQASFAERIAVRVSGEYRPVLPTFLLFGESIPVEITVTMGSEG